MKQQPIEISRAYYQEDTLTITKDDGEQMEFDLNELKEDQFFEITYDEKKSRIGLSLLNGLNDLNVFLLNELDEYLELRDEWITDPSSVYGSTSFLINKVGCSYNGPDIKVLEEEGHYFLFEPIDNVSIFEDDNWFRAQVLAKDVLNLSMLEQGLI